MTTISEFASHHSITLTTDKTICGAHGVIYQFSKARFAVAMNLQWRQAQQIFKANGFGFDQNNEFNGIVTFDPDDLTQADVAIRLAVCQQTLPLNMPVSKENTQSAKSTALKPKAIKEGQESADKKEGR